MPARAAVFDSLKRYDGYGLIPLPTREFMQMAGRAGRRGLDSEGTLKHADGSVGLWRV